MNLIDTNVLVRFLIGDTDIKYVGTRLLFDRLRSGEENVEMLPLVFFQTIFVLKSFYNIPKEVIADVMLNLLDYPGIILEKKQIYINSLEIWQKNNFEIIDCYLTAIFQTKKYTHLYSYDKAIGKLGVSRKEP